MGVIQFDELRSVDGNNVRVLQSLYAFTRRLACNQALGSGDKRVFKFKAFSDIDVPFEIIDTQGTFLNKINGIAGMADGLHYSIFFKGDFSADFQQVFKRLIFYRVNG